MKEYTFKGTPGPWKWDGKPWDYDKDMEAPWVVGGENDKYDVLSGEIICGEYDAHLIAAAPDLLQACISLVDQLCGDQEAEDELEKGLGMTLAWKVQQAKSAIHKALNL